MSAPSNSALIGFLCVSALGFQVPVEMSPEFFTLPPGSVADFAPRLQVLLTGPPVLLPDLPVVVPGRIGFPP